MEQQMSRDEQIGFHKGVIDTLLKERTELVKIVSITNKLLEMHLKALKELGVDLEQQVKQAQAQAEQEQQKEEPKKTQDNFGEFY